MAAQSNQPVTMSRLFQALKGGQLNFIEKSLKQNRVPNSERHLNDYLLLQILLEKKKSKTAKELIKAGCRVKALPSEIGTPPLVHAFTHELKEIAAMLIKKGASIYLSPNCKSTVLHLAAQKRSMKMLECAVKGNIDVNLLDYNGKTAIQILLESCNDDKFNTEIGKERKIEMIKFLLSKKVTLNFRSESNGQTSLHYAAALRDPVILRSVLVKFNLVNTRDKKGQTPLHVLLRSNCNSEDDIFEMVDLLLNEGAKIDIPDCEKVTVFHLSALKKYLKILHKFLQYQCDINVKDRNDNSILHRLLESSCHLIKEKNFLVVVNLVLSKSDGLINAQNCFGLTPVHITVDNSNYELAKLMLSKFQNINIQDTRGDTLLHMLIRKFSPENYDLIKYILELGANINIKNSTGLSPLDLANNRGNDSLLLLLHSSSKPSNGSTDSQVNTQSNVLETTKAQTDKSVIERKALGDVSNVHQDTSVKVNAKKRPHPEMEESRTPSKIVCHRDE